MYEAYRRRFFAATTRRSCFIKRCTTFSESGGREEPSRAMSVQAWLPNGVVVDVRGVALRQTVELFEALGRMRCSVSTKE
jgi:hypothetical protein